jgi:hypothetical protein
MMSKFNGKLRIKINLDDYPVSISDGDVKNMGSQSKSSRLSTINKNSMKKKYSN